MLDPVLEKKKKTHQWSSENASDSDDTFAELMDDMRREKDEPVIDESTPGPSRVRKRIERWEVRDDDKSSHTSDDDEDVLGVEGDVSHADSDVVDEIQEMVTHIIVNYEGSFFPGLVTRVKKKGIEVSCLVKSGLNHWKWPEVRDICVYDRKDIVQVIKPPAILNSRGIMEVPEME